MEGVWPLTSSLFLGACMRPRRWGSAPTSDAVLEGEKGFVSPTKNPMHANHNPSKSWLSIIYSSNYDRAGRYTYYYWYFIVDS